MLLVGNKNDRPDKVVSTEKAQGIYYFPFLYFFQYCYCTLYIAFADSYGIPFIETSAKSNSNIDEAFHKLSLDLIEIRDNGGEKPNKNDKGVRITSLNFLKSQFNKCC